MGRPGTGPSVRELTPAVLGEILGLLTHDLRNPLAALSSNVGFLTMVGENLSQDVREALFDLQLSVEVLSRIADAMEVVSQELRDVSCGEAASFSVASMVTALRPPVERAAESHGVSLRFDAALDARIRVAEPAFSRALSSLLHNAISVAPSGSEVGLAVSREGDEVCFRVEDRGPRLPDELLDAAFSANGQLATKGKIYGRYSRGLCLYVVGRSAELAGARVRVPESDAGSVIEILAPLAP